MRLCVSGKCSAAVRQSVRAHRVHGENFGAGQDVRAKVIGAVKKGTVLVSHRALFHYRLRYHSFSLQLLHGLSEPNAGGSVRAREYLPRRRIART